MTLAAIGDSTYNLVLLLHIIAAVVAVSPAVIHPLLYMGEKQRPDADVSGLASRLAGLPAKIYMASLIAAGLLGIVLIALSDSVIGMGDPWISASFLAWIVANGVLHATIFPAERAIAKGETSDTSRLEMFYLVNLALMIVLLYLMVFKPGA